MHKGFSLGVLVLLIVLNLTICDTSNPYSPFLPYFFDLFKKTNQKQQQHAFCGISESFSNHRQPRRSGRLISGREAEKNAWPWQVSLELNIEPFGNIGHWCGGVLIKPTWILTAAHCVKNRLMSKFGEEKWTAVIGSGNRLEGSRVNVEDILIHPDYDEYKNDIALLKIPEDPSVINIAPACLPTSLSTKNESFEGINCVATGWGKLKPHGKLQSDLHQVQLKVVHNKHCDTMYKMKYGIRLNQNQHLCAGPILSGGRGTCIGDSGGPLQCNMKDGRWYLAGITSFGSGCAKPGYPDVFTRLTHYTDWIENTIQNY